MCTLADETLVLLSGPRVAMSRLRHVREGTPRSPAILAAWQKPVW